MLFSPTTARKPDHDLLLRTRRGDERAARGLWSRFGPRLIAYAAGLLRDSGGRAAAEDVVQSVFCRILETPRADLRAVRDVPAWLTTLTRHTALNVRRAEQRERQRRAAITDQAEPAAAAPVIVGADDLRGPDVNLHARLGSIDEDLREIVLLKHAVGLTFDQIAMTLDQNRSTINSRYRRALELLRCAPEPDKLDEHQVQTIKAGAA